MQQQIISSSCRATPTKHTHNLQHTLSFKLISLISLIFLSVLIEASPVPLPIASIPDLQSFNLQSFANYAAAAYCEAPLNNWDCGEVCQRNNGTEVVKVFNNDVLNTLGIL